MTNEVLQVHDGASRPAQVTWIGHATVLVDLAGVRLLTDPLLTDRVAHLRRRRSGAEVDLSTVDAVLISHLHVDHLHLRSLRQLGTHTLVVVPRGAGAWLRSRGIERVEELSVGEHLDIGVVQVLAVPALHGDRRGPHSRVRAAPLGFVIGSGEGSVYFAGDTDLMPEMAELRGVEVALLPIWGWGPTLGTGHLDPLRAVTAAERIDPGLVVPIHWGTFSPLRLRPGPPHWLDTPAELLRRSLETSRLRDRFTLCLPGESVLVDRSGPPGR